MTTLCFTPFFVTDPHGTAECKYTVAVAAAYYKKLAEDYAGKDCETDSVKAQKDCLWEIDDCTSSSNVKN